MCVSGTALRDRIAGKVADCLSRPPQSASAGRKSGADQAQEVSCWQPAACLVVAVFCWRFAIACVGLVYGPLACAVQLPLCQHAQMHKMVDPAVGEAQVAELRTEIEEEQRLLLQFQDQKMALAVQCYDLVDAHVGDLNKNMELLRDELEVWALAGRPAGVTAITSLVCQVYYPSVVFLWRLSNSHISVAVPSEIQR